MPIYAPGKRINPSLLRRRSSDARKGVYANLSLTSMVDMFAIMVIFLLQSFSAQGEIIVLPSQFQLPEAKSTGELQRAPTIIISQDEVIFVEKSQLQGEVITQTEKVRQASEWNIPELQQALVDFKAVLEQQAIEQRALGETVEDDLRKINISADRRLEFQVVKKVIYTAGFAGFPNFQFSVIAGGGIQDILNPESQDQVRIPEPY